jgi:hypothetical protein
MVALKIQFMFGYLDCARKYLYNNILFQYYLLLIRSNKFEYFILVILHFILLQNLEIVFCLALSYSFSNIYVFLHLDITVRKRKWGKSINGQHMFHRMSFFNFNYQTSPLNLLSNLIFFPNLVKTWIDFLTQIWYWKW